MKKFIILFLLFFCCCAFAQYAVDQPISNSAAFQFSAAARDSQTIIARWKIAPGYYLYRTRFHFRAIKPEGAKLGKPLLPSGIQKTSPGIGTYVVYQGVVRIPIPVIKPQGENIVLEAHYQGCSEKGFCYPPTSQVVPIDLSKNYMTFKKGLLIDTPISKKIDKTTPAKSTNFVKIHHLLKKGDLWALIIGFLGFGLLIAFTPCVLPMIPILSAIITGQKKVTTAHAFFLSLFYVLGMAITYAVAGVLVGFIGGSIQAALQVPWIIILFSLIFVAMALSLFGLYDIQLPQRWRRKIAEASEHQKRGTYFGTFIMGILSTLILSPCVTPPLVGVLSYIGQTGNAALGGLALFIMAIGMGLPLLVIGVSHGKLIPKTGPWMNAVKNGMGILMLGLAIWILQRVLSGTWIMLLWAALAIGIALFLGALSSIKTKWGLVRKALGIIVFVYGILLIIGAVTGHYNPLKPLEFTETSTLQKNEVTFKTVNTIADIEKAIAIGKKQGKPVLLDFWAQWCISCKELDEFTFSNPKVKKRLADFILLRVDVTRNSAKDKIIERHFNVIAPPTILFFKDGKELKQARIIGVLDPDAFLTHLNQVAPKNNL